MKWTKFMCSCLVVSLPVAARPQSAALPEQVATTAKPTTMAQTPLVSEKQRKSLVAELDTVTAEDIPELIRRAEARDVKAQWTLGVTYAEGKVVAKDYAKSWFWIQRSAETGWPIGQSAAGIAYMTGRGVERNPKEAVAWFRKSAEQGYAQGQARLGIAYFLGEGVSRDPNEAISWFRKAAEQDNPLAQYWLANAYHDGEGVSKDTATALDWLRKAADQGEPAAGYRLGKLYDTGEGVPQDAMEAVKWYRKAADHDHHAAQFDLAISYHEGQGVPKSMDEAEKWFTKASDAGWAPATYYLGKMHSDKQFQTSRLAGEVAIKFFEKSAEQGYPLGALVLEDIYSNRFLAFHLWITRDEAKACHWLLVARELSKTDRWAANMPRDSATVRDELPKRIPKMQKKLKENFATCEQSAQEWVKAHPEALQETK